MSFATVFPATPNNSLDMESIESLSNNFANLFIDLNNYEQKIDKEMEQYEQINIKLSRDVGINKSEYDYVIRKYTKVSPSIIINKNNEDIYNDMDNELSDDSDCWTEEQYDEADYEELDENNEVCVDDMVEEEYDEWHRMV